MRPGRYAAADGSFGRSAGVAVGRGVVLLAVALVIGIVLLNATSNDPPGTRVSASSPSPASTPKTTGKGSAAPSTTVAPTTTLPPAHAPKDVKVLVANGSGTNKVATNASAPLKAAGFNVLAAANADKVQESSVYSVAGYEKDGADIAAALGLPATAPKAMPSPAPVKSDANPSVIVVIGSADAARFAQAATSTTAKEGAVAKPATTTTAKPATTTTAKPATTTTAVH